MNTSKNNQLKMKQGALKRVIFLKFCYFSILILFISCKNETNKPNKLSVDSKQATEVITSTKTTSKKIIFFGDSLTAGYGLDDVNDAFPGLIQQKIDSLQLKYIVINSGVSGETTAGGKNRIDWVLSTKPDIFILELGANDGLRGLPLTETEKNLQIIINRVKNKYPDTKIILAGMQIPPNMGPEYTTTFKNIFPKLAEKNKLTLIPFLLENVGGVSALNQTDGIHPTAEGHSILAENVWIILKEIL